MDSTPAHTRLAELRQQAKHLAAKRAELLEQLEAVLASIRWVLREALTLTDDAGRPLITLRGLGEWFGVSAQAALNWRRSKKPAIRPGSPGGAASTGVLNTTDEANRTDPPHPN